MIGQLRVRLGLYTPSETQDEFGGASRVWNFKRQLWGAITPKSITEVRDNGRLTVTQSYKVTIRHISPFPERARLIWGDRILRVVAASDPDTRRERLHLICEEEAL
ncbi:phage head closure protein [Litorimonas sp. RW-G-Af-16]|uniref:phage head closure protein n=1 Tax=Litorimonas sp. RW-G-Af-16 TaxID=3241168 RepID=UPI00390CC5CF